MDVGRLNLLWVVHPWVDGHEFYKWEEQAIGEQAGKQHSSMAFVSAPASRFPPGSCLDSLIRL